MKMHIVCAQNIPFCFLAQLRKKITNLNENLSNTSEKMLILWVEKIIIYLLNFVSLTYSNAKLITVKVLLQQWNIPHFY